MNNDNLENPDFSSRFNATAKRPLLAGALAVALVAGSSLALAGNSKMDVPSVADTPATQSAPAGDILVMMDEEVIPASPLAQLDLSSDQQQQITRINDQERKDIWRLQGDQMDAQNRLRDLYHADEFDADAVIKANHQLANVQEQMINIKTDARTRIYDVLTPEQRALI